MGLGEIYYEGGIIYLGREPLHTLRKRHTIACLLIRTWMKRPLLKPSSFDQVCEKLKLLKIISDNVIASEPFMVGRIGIDPLANNLAESSVKSGSVDFATTPQEKLRLLV